MLSKPQGLVQLERLGKLINNIHPNRSRIRHLLACGISALTTTLPCGPSINHIANIKQYYSYQSLLLHQFPISMQVL
jgi:hypothetical protein